MTKQKIKQLANSSINQSIDSDRIDLPKIIKLDSSHSVGHS